MVSTLEKRRKQNKIRGSMDGMGSKVGIGVKRIGILKRVVRDGVRR